MCMRAVAPGGDDSTRPKWTPPAAMRVNAHALCPLQVETAKLLSRRERERDSQCLTRPSNCHRRPSTGAVDATACRSQLPTPARLSKVSGPALDHDLDRTIGDVRRGDRPTIRRCCQDYEVAAAGV